MNSTEETSNEQERFLITVVTPETLIYVSGRSRWTVERLYNEIQKKAKIEENAEYDLYLCCGKKLFIPMKHDQNLSFYDMKRFPEVVFLTKNFMKSKGSRLSISKSALKFFSDQSKEKLLSLAVRTAPSEDLPKRKSTRPRSQTKFEISPRLREDVDKSISDRNSEQLKQLLDNIHPEDTESKQKLEFLDQLNGQASIHTAIRSNDPTIIETFLEFYSRIGADVNIKDRYGWTILHHGVSIASGTPNDEETLKILLKSESVLVDVENDDHNTPLHYL